jgi:acetyltransferase-like isoleucine patch superfamily enzyme
VLLYGADIGEGATVAAHSVVLKRERLQPGRNYEGCPTRERLRESIS